MCQIESPSDSEQTISGFWHYLNYINFYVINNAAKFVSSEKKKYQTIPFNMCYEIFMLFNIRKYS